MNCMMSELPQSTCSLTDNACICSNANLTAAISGCLVQTCTVIETLRKEIHNFYPHCYDKTCKQIMTLMWTNEHWHRGPKLFEGVLRSTHTFATGSTHRSLYFVCSNLCGSLGKGDLQITVDEWQVGLLVGRLDHLELFGRYCVPLGL